MEPMTPERAAVEARRALLRQQTQLLALQLPWLSNPDTIPANALASGPDTADLPELCTPRRPQLCTPHGSFEDCAREAEVLSSLPPLRSQGLGSDLVVLGPSRDKCRYLGSSR